MTRSDYVAGAAKAVQGVLYCPQCALEVTRAERETLVFRQSLRCGGMYECARCRSPIPLADVQAGAVIHYAGDLSCRSCSRNLIKLLAAERRRSARLRAQTQGGAKSGAAPACAGCLGPLTGGGTVLERDGDRYCADCAEGVGSVLNNSVEALKRLTQFTCGGCHQDVAAEQLVSGGAVRSRGIIYCARCKLDFGRSSRVQQGMPERPAASAVMSSTPCGCCGRRISNLDVRMDRAFEINGALHCQSCKSAIDETRRKKELRRRVHCAHCARRVSRHELQKGSATVYQGNLYCARCGRDPAVVLGSGKPSAAGCPGCEAPLPPDGVCLTCAGRLATIQRRSLGQSSELLGLLSIPCDRCGASLSDQALDGGDGQVVGEELLCEGCSAKASTRPCPRCRDPLELGQDPSECAGCRKAAGQEFVEVEEWLGLSVAAETALRCSLCRQEVSHADLARKKATSINGNLHCARCRERRSAGQVSNQAKLCPTCDGPLARPTFDCGGRSFCRRCEPVFRALLEECQLESGASVHCVRCKGPARGAGALRVAGAAYCQGCRKGAALLLQVEVRQRREHQGKPQLPFRRVFEGVLGAVVLVLVFAIGASITKKLRASRSQPTLLAKTAELDPGALEALGAAKQLAMDPATTTEEAVRVLKSVRGFQERVAAEPALSPEFDALVKKLAAQVQTERETDRAVIEYQASLESALAGRRYRECLQLGASVFQQAQRARARVRQAITELEARVHSAAQADMAKAGEEIERQIAWGELTDAEHLVDALSSWAIDQAAVERLAGRVKAAREQEGRRLFELAKLTGGDVDRRRAQSALKERLHGWAQSGKLSDRGAVQLRYERASDLRVDLKVWRGRKGAVRLSPLPGGASGKGIHVRAGRRGGVLLVLDLPLVSVLDASLKVIPSRRPSSGAHVALLLGLREKRHEGFGVDWGLIPSRLGPSGLRPLVSAERPAGPLPRILALGLETTPTGKASTALRGTFIDLVGEVKSQFGPVPLAASRLRGRLAVFVQDTEVWITGLELRGVVDAKELSKQ